MSERVRRRDGSEEGREEREKKEGEAREKKEGRREGGAERERM